MTQSEKKVEETFSSFVEVLFEQMNEVHSQDPFDAYIGKLKQRFYTNPSTFSLNFSHGYQAIINELKSTS